MPIWYRSILPAKEALILVNASLENARGAKDRDRALKYCKEADTFLRRIDISTVTTDQSVLEQIIAAFREHGRMLVALNESKKAQRSFSKVKDLEDTTIPDTPVHSLTPVASRSPTVGQISTGPSRSTSPVLPPSTLTSQSALSTSNSNTTTGQNSGQNSEIIPATIFAKNSAPYAFDGSLPGPDKRLDNARQLVYCLGLLLQDPAELDDFLDTDTRTWVQATRKNTDEQERLKNLAMDLLREFTREELKDAMAVAEVACLAPILEAQDFRFLLGQFLDSISSSVLLNTRALDGLGYVVQSAPQRGIDADDLVKILGHLNSRLEHTHSDSLGNIYHLTRVVSHILDAMALGDVQGLNRVSLHTPLKVYLQKLMKSADPYLAFQAAYASQALLWISNDEELWKAVLRRAGTMTIGVARIASAAKTLNVVEFINGLDNIQEGVEGAGEFFRLVTNAYNAAIESTKGGQDLQAIIKEGFNFSRKQKWYPLLRATDALLRDGEFINFKVLVCDAPCRCDTAFQWGLCQRLRHIAADPQWAPDTRQDAIEFLGQIYRNDTAWGKKMQVKQCILDILMQLASESGTAMQAAKSLLQDLRNDGDATKKAHYKACLEGKPILRHWKVVLPLLRSSPLLDRVQKKPNFSLQLREFRRQRLEGRGQEVYIPPEAKAGRQAPDESLFPLMENVRDFLSGDQEVLLISGDSGAGKSTFNQELEWEMWDAYDKDKAWIPIFVWLPSIDRPDKDIIAQRLKDFRFNEEQIRELMDDYKFFLICDGYDECRLAYNLYNTNELNKVGKWQAKMVISCRSERLGISYQSLFQPKDRNGQKGATLLREAMIAPFSTSKIRGYVEKYVEKYESVKKLPWKVETYMSAIEGIPGFQELVSNPFLLKLSLEVLPEMAGAHDLSSIKITRVTLYDKYVENWVKERGEERLANNSKLTEGKWRAFDMLLANDFMQNAIDFMKNLALAMFEHQDGQTTVEYSRKGKSGTSWKDEFFQQDDDERTILLEACPIIRIGKGNQYKFIHLSFQEYGLARAVFEPHQEVPVNMELAPDSSSPLFRWSFVNKPSVLQFLAERVLQEPIFEKQLHSFIEESKTGKTWNIAAANAITILVKAGIRFNRADLKGIGIPGADLSGGQFDSAQLQGADLSNVILRNIWLRQANLSNARMEDVEFGERPYLMEESQVNSCAYSPDGRNFIFSLDGGTISVYDTLTWTKTHTVQGHEDHVNCVVYSPSGRQIASCSWDNTVRLWDAQTGAPGSILSGHTNVVLSVVYSPSGHQIASGSKDNTVRLWNVQTGALSFILRGHAEWIQSVVYSPSGHQIASGSNDKTVRLWDAQTGSLSSILIGHTGWIQSVVYSPSGHQIASGSNDKTVRLWNAQTGATSSILSGHTSVVRSVVYSPSGHQIASGSWDNTVRLWDAQTGAPCSILSGHTGWVQRVVYSPSGHQIASGSNDKTVRLWDVQTEGPSSILSGHTSWVQSVVYSPSGHQIASGSYDKTVRLWDARTGAPGPNLGDHTHFFLSVAYSPSGHQIVSGSWDNTVRLWDAQTGAPGSILSGHTNVVLTVVYSPTGHQIASGSWDNTVRLWDAHTGAPCSILSGHTGWVQSVVYSPSGHQIASGSNDKTVRLWDAQTGAPCSILIGHTETVPCAVYSPCGHQIASGSGDKTVRLWDAQTGAPCSILNGHTKTVQSVAYSPNGQQIASGSDDMTVRLWDVNSGQFLAVVNGFHGPINSIAWNASSNSTYFATGCADRSVCVWQVVEEEHDRCYVILQWATGSDTLVASNASLKDVQGLSTVNMRLLEQRGAICDSTTPELKQN